jgi:hypothetical protein
MRILKGFWLALLACFAIKKPQCYLHGNHEGTSIPAYVSKRIEFSGDCWDCLQHLAVLSGEYA